MVVMSRRLAKIHRGETRFPKVGGIGVIPERIFLLNRFLANKAANIRKQVKAVVAKFSTEDMLTGPTILSSANNGHFLDFLGVRQTVKLSILHQGKPVRPLS
jgi:hypothetical protein